MPIAGVSLDDESNPQRVIFDYGGNSGTLSEKQIEYYRRILDLEQVAIGLQSTPEGRVTILKKLQLFSERVLTHELTDDALADSEYQSILTDIESFALQSRRSYIKEVQRKSVWLLAAATIAIIISYFILGYEDHLLNRFQQLSDVEISYFHEFLGAFGFALIGLFLGTNLVALFSNRVSGVVTFFGAKRQQLDVGLQLWYLAILVLIFLLVLAWELIQVGVGARLLNDFISREGTSGVPAYGVIVGILVSFAEPKVMELLTTLFDPQVRTESDRRQ